MIRKTKIKIQKIIQVTYLLTFLITSIGIAGNVDLGLKTPGYIFKVFIISGILTVSKLIYCSIKYPNQKYIWK